MKDPRNVIRRPIVTEKSLQNRDQHNHYAFAVSQDANRQAVRAAVEERFHVHVKDVSIMRVKGKLKKLGRFEGKRADWKKAIVTLAKGERIEELVGGA